MNPFSVYTDAGKTCADNDDHIGLDQIGLLVPLGARAGELQDRDAGPARSRSSKTFPTATQLGLSRVRPARRRQEGHGRRSCSARSTTARSPRTRPACATSRATASWLAEAGYKSVTAPLGKRYEKVVNGITVQIDLYSPKEFSGLDDYAHFANFQKALSEHEIVAWDGHSMLGASRLLGAPDVPGLLPDLPLRRLPRLRVLRPADPPRQGRLVGQARHHVERRRGDARARTSSRRRRSRRSCGRSTTATARRGAASSRGAQRVGDSTFGVSGVRDNCFTPTGTRCH